MSGKSRRIARLLLAGAWMLLLRPAAEAQCCAAGNPVNTNCGLSEGGAHVLNVSLSYVTSFSDAYYTGTTPLDKSYAESGLQFSSLALSYGVSRHLRVIADVGYFFRKSQHFVSGDYTRYAQGISDGTLGVNYSSYQSDDQLLALSQSAKVTIPLGDVTQAYDGIVLPIDVQPSSGNYRYQFGMQLTKNFASSPFAVMGSAAVEFSQAIETRNTYHKYGNLYTASLIGSYRIAPMLQGILQFRAEVRDRALNGSIDQLPAGQSRNNQYAYLNSSGGVIGYVSPQISGTLWDDWMLTLQYNYPFYKNVYGEEQLTNAYSISASVSHTIDFGGSEAGADLATPDTTLPSFVLSVEGNCDMCKTRIDAAASGVALVRYASWDPDGKLLTVYYKGARPSNDAVETAVAAVGHDTEHHRAPDEVYEKLPECCLYRK